MNQSDPKGVCNVKKDYFKQMLFEFSILNASELSHKC